MDSDSAAKALAEEMADKIRKLIDERFHELMDGRASTQAWCCHHWTQASTPNLGSAAVFKCTMCGKYRHANLDAV